MSLSLIMSMMVTFIGALYTISTLLLPSARIGIPSAPKVFPLFLGILMILLGILLVIAEFRKFPKTEKELQQATKSLEFGASEKNIILTILNGVLYALLFDRLGYVLSTLIFLELELIIFRGKKHWMNSLIISAIFAVIAFLLFYTGLGVYLPTSFLGFI